MQQPNVFRMLVLCLGPVTVFGFGCEPMSPVELAEATAQTSAALGSCTHRVQAVITVIDNSREGGDPITAAGLPIKVQLRDTGVYWTVDHATTNAAGAVDVLLSGVKCDTTIRLQASLEDDELRVYKGLGSVQIDLADLAVTNDDPAEFGTLAITPCGGTGGSCHTEQLSALAFTLAKTYLATGERLLGSSVASHVGKKLAIHADDSGDSGSNANRTRLRLYTGAGTFSKSTLAHEMGHWIAGNSGTVGWKATDYLAEKHASTYPEDRPPYVYEASTPAELKDLEGHERFQSGDDWVFSFEHAEEAAVEGHASAVGDMLQTGGRCWNDAPPPLHFDGAHREDSVYGAFCDLVDDGVETVGKARHAYLPATDIGKLTRYAPREAWLDSAGDGNTSYAYAISSDMKNLMQIDWKTGAAAAVYTAGLSAVSAAGVNNVCLADGVDVKCFIPGGFTTNPLPPHAPPPGGSCWPWKPKKVAVSLGSVAVLARGDCLDASSKMVSTVAVFYSSTYPSFGAPSTWTQVLEQPVGAGIDEKAPIAMDDPGYVLFIATDRQILSCDPRRCATTLGAYSGHATLSGFRRGSDALYAGIRNLQSSDRFLYVSDDYGVTRLDVGTSMRPIAEQVVGAGASTYFRNDLSYRSLTAKEMTHAFFATNEQRDILQYFQFSFTGMRRATSAPTLVELRPGWGKTGRNIATTRTYCATENVRIAPKDVILAYRGLKYGGVDVSTLISNIASVSAADRDAVLATNWITLPGLGCGQLDEDEEIRSELHSQKAPPSQQPISCGGSLGDEGNQ